MSSFGFVKLERYAPQNVKDYGECESGEFQKYFDNSLVSKLNWNVLNFLKSIKEETSVRALPVDWKQVQNVQYLPINISLAFKRLKTF